MLNTRKIKKNIHSLSSSSSSSSEEKKIQNTGIENFNNDDVFIEFDEVNNLNNINNMNNLIVQSAKKIISEKKEIIKNEIPINNMKVDYDKIQNKFIIHEQNEIKTILLSDVVNSILNAETNDAYIKKYLFIISFNSITNQNEYNFMPSILTENLDMLIELENSIFMIINNDDFETKELKHKTNLILFFYQIIMFIYKSSFNYYNEEKLKTIYNILSYRFSLIILKQIYNLKDEIKYLNSNFKESLEIKHKLESKIFGNLKENNILNEEKNEILVGGDGEDDNDSNNSDESESSNNSGGSNFINENVKTVNNNLSPVSSDTSDSYSSYSSADDESYNKNSASDNASAYES